MPTGNLKSHIFIRVEHGDYDFATYSDHELSTHTSTGIRLDRPVSLGGDTILTGFLITPVIQKDAIPISHPLGVA